MSEDSLNDAIAAKWESQGLDASNDNTDLPSEGDYDDGPDPAEADTGAADEAAAGDEAATTDEEAAAGAGDAAGAEADPPKLKGEGDAAAAEGQAAAQKEAEDDLAESLGLGKPPADPKARARWWKKQLPYSLVHKTVTEREKKILEKHTGELKTFTDENTTYKTRFTDVETVEKIISEKPDQYVRTLAHLFPDTYGKMFAQILNPTAGQKTNQLPAIEDPGAMPEPDYELPDGSKTYSLEGMKKKDEWTIKMAQKQMLEGLKPQLDFLDAQKTEAQKANEKRQKDELVAQQHEAGIQAAQKAVDLAKTWEGVTDENINELLGVAAKLDARYDPIAALALAHQQLIIPKLKADRDKMHASIVAELKKKSVKSTAAGLTQSRVNQPVAAEQTTDLDERIRNAWKAKGLID